jgi:hypothetical protein
MLTLTLSPSEPKNAKCYYYPPTVSVVKVAHHHTFDEHPIPLANCIYEESKSDSSRMRWALLVIRSTDTIASRN